MLDSNKAIHRFCLRAHIIQERALLLIKHIWISKSSFSQNDSFHVTHTSFLTHKVRRNRLCKTYNYWGYFCAAIHSLFLASALITSSSLPIILYPTTENWSQPISILDDDSFAFRSLKILGPYQQKLSLLPHTRHWARSGAMVEIRSGSCSSPLLLKMWMLDYTATKILSGRDLCFNTK